MPGAVQSPILVIDDEPSLHEALRELLGDGYDLHSAPDAERGLEIVRKERFACILLDLTLPGMDGLTFLQRFRERDVRTPVIVLTATKTVQTAVRAMRLGAEDYIPKPWDPDALRLAVSRAVERCRLLDRMEAYEAGVRPVRFEDIVTRSPAMQAVLDLARQMGRNDSRVLITGDTGTGKEVLARAIHDNGTRAGRPFLAVNCAAIPAELAESELFGHEKGAFTGALRTKRGWFELAHEGTLFLDEVTCLSPELQAKLLRVLQDGLVYRVGSEAPVRVDARVLAASNRDVRAEIAAGRFREDLFYRLNVVPVHIPQLRERREDIPLLLEHFREAFNRRFHKALAGYDAEALRLLGHYDWPGNVRELEHTVERLVILETGGTIGVRHLPMDIVLADRRAPEREATLELVSLREAREQFEREYLVSALGRSDWNQTQAAENLGISRNTLILKMQQYDISPPWAAPRQPAK
jgi:two-component system, NtrC family, nitrogen regulation response regulator NtrX